jgi:cytochrome P450
LPARRHYDKNEAIVDTSGGPCPYRGVGRDFAPFGSRYLKDPYAFFARARAHEPVFYSPKIEYWVVSRYGDVKEILKDPITFSAEIALSPMQPFSTEVIQLLSDGGYRPKPVLSNCSPPDHTRIRQLLNLTFTPRRVASMEPHVVRLANLHVDRFEKDGRADLVRQLTYDIPALVLFNLLGIPDEDVPLIQTGAENRLPLIWGRPSPGEEVNLARGVVSFWQYCEELVEKRLRHPLDDLTSELVRVRSGDDSVLSVQEIVSVVFGLLFAGHETTTNLLSNLIRQVLSRREVWQSICQSHELITDVIEEVLRLDTSVIAWRRLTTRPSKIGGVSIPAGARLLLLLGSANHDESIFRSPETADASRHNAKEHLSFGYGIHYCLGAALARLQARVVLKILTRRLPHMQLVEGQRFEYPLNIAFRGPQHLWVHWDV